MKNNNGFGKFEVFTIIVLLLGLGAFLMYTILGYGKSVSEKLKTMKSDAFQFNKAVYTNIDTFRNERVVYLDEVLDNRLVGKMKSPFSSNNCDVEESKVESPDTNTRYVTFKCDEYLIDHEDSSDLSNISVYKVGEWSTTPIEGENVQQKELYNCSEGGNDVFDHYMEGEYFVTQINKLYGQNHYDLNTITSDVCELKVATFYRTKELVKENESE